MPESVCTTLGAGAGAAMADAGRCCCWNANAAPPAHVPAAAANRSVCRESIRAAIRKRCVLCVGVGVGVRFGVGVASCLAK